MLPTGLMTVSFEFGASIVSLPIIVSTTDEDVAAFFSAAQGALRQYDHLNVSTK